MGQRGPAPKPTALRRLEGNLARRPLPENEPKYQPGIPDRPRHLSRRGRRVWDELVDEMALTGMLCKVDGRALWQLAEDECLLQAAYTGIWTLVAQIEKTERETGKKAAGGPVFALLNQSSGRLAMAAIRNLANRVIIERREFGLTPSSRCRVEGSGEGTVGPLDALEMKLCG
jgi:phage terminase small subunit